MDASAASLHNLRGQLGTIRLSATLLEHETHLTNTGQKALRRISIALERAEEDLLRLERATGVTTQRIAS